MCRVIWIVVGTALMAGCAAYRPGTSDTGVVSFALVGDQQYGATREAEFGRLMAQMDEAPLDFVIHVGDVKGGTSTCSDSLLMRRFDTFDASRHPFILLPGDNEWTDCHRSGGDPLANLDRLRGLFHGGNETIGRTRIALQRQSADPAFPEFVEHVRWERGGVLFVTVNVVGSNNNLGRTPTMDAEHARRTTAVLAWLEASLRLAEDGGMLGVLIAMHGNPFVSRPSPPNGFTPILEGLQSLVASTTMPMALVHGDTHHCQIDHPLADPNSGEPIERFTRVEVFGDPHTHWIHGKIEPRDPAVFSFEPVLVPGNPEAACAVD